MLACLRPPRDAAAADLRCPARHPLRLVQCDDFAGATKQLPDGAAQLARDVLLETRQLDQVAVAFLPKSRLCASRPIGSGAPPHAGTRREQCSTHGSGRRSRGGTGVQALADAAL